MRRLPPTLSITFSKCLAHAGPSFPALGHSRINAAEGRWAEKVWRGTKNTPVRWLCGHYSFPVVGHLQDICPCWAADWSTAPRTVAGACSRRKTCSALATGSATAPSLLPTCGHQQMLRRGCKNRMNAQRKLLQNILLASRNLWLVNFPRQRAGFLSLIDILYSYISFNESG